MHAFRRTLGDYVLYEVSPFDEPSVLGAFYIPDVSEAWLRGDSPSSQPSGTP
jgi:hypothetical protein